MSERSYVVMGQLGPVRQLYASLRSAMRRVERNARYRVLTVEHDDLPPLEGDEYQHAESRMLYWTERCQRLRPDAPLPSIEWHNVTASDAREIVDVYRSWESSIRARLPPAVRELIEGRLQEVLARVVSKLEQP